MKFLLSLLLITSSFISYTQPPPPGTHLYRPIMDNFVGTWKWVNGNDEVTIKLKKVHRFFFRESYFDDIVMGCHKYIKNGIIIENTLPQFDSITAQGDVESIFLWYHNPVQKPNELTGQLKDPLKGRSNRLFLEFIAGATPSLKWSLYRLGGGYYIQGQPAPPTGYTLPKNIILIKQP